tara:strand:+ start:14046 stop:14333 length:288 start_codon:yes stop_codon:yes gene_type:complete
MNHYSPLRNDGLDGERQDCAKAAQLIALMADDIRKLRKMPTNTDTLDAARDQLCDALSDALSDFVGQTDSLPRPNTYDATKQAEADLHAYQRRAL